MGYVARGLGSALDFGHFVSMVTMPIGESSADSNVRGHDIAFSAKCPQAYIVGQFDDTFDALMTDAPTGFLIARAR